MSLGPALAFAFGALCVVQAFRVRADKDRGGDRAWFVSWIIFDWSPSVLVGIGAAISTLAVMTPRR
jgi:hypothetical protein